MIDAAGGAANAALQKNGRTHLAHRSRRSSLWPRAILYVAIFAALFAWFFLTSSRTVALYDEGLELTDAMRVAAGQVIHRDFYFAYGPAIPYIMAGLFRLFGPSVLAERLFWTSSIALGGVGTFAVVQKLANRKWAAAVLVLSVLWGESLGLNTFLNIWSTWLLLPLFTRTLNRRRAFAAGLLVGIATLFRYDTGFALALTHLLIIAVTVYLTGRNAPERIRDLRSTASPYLLGFAVPVVPLFLAYWTVGAIPDFLYDVFIFVAKYYRAARNLPFPHIHRQNFDESVVYTLPLLVALGFYAVARSWLQRRSDLRPHPGSELRPNPQPARPIPEWLGAIFSFALVAAVMYMKGLVRIGVGQMYMALSPAILLALLLCMHRRIFAPIERAAFAVVLFLFVAAGVLPIVRGLHAERQQRSVLLAWILHPSTQNPQPPFDYWCRERNVVSKGFCFFPDNDHIQAIDYIDAHTRPNDTLYVGLPQHQRLYINDNFTYFATQRLPATKWSHFDPFLQNRADIQRIMIGELDRNHPPYIVLDSEFENDREPNGSSVSTGVRLLDDYIAQHYITVQTFGELTILRRHS